MQKEKSEKENKRKQSLERQQAAERQKASEQQRQKDEQAAEAAGKLNGRLLFFLNTARNDVS